MGEHRLPDVGDRAVPPVTGRRPGDGLLDARRRVEADVARDLGILRAGDDDPADVLQALERVDGEDPVDGVSLDRKSTRLNSSHGYISYAVFCLKKKKNNIISQKQAEQFITV